MYDEYEENSERLARTIALVEVNRTDIHWFEPRDIHISEIEQNPAAVFSETHRGGSHVGYADGTVRWLSYEELCELTADDFRIR